MIHIVSGRWIAAVPIIEEYLYDDQRQRILKSEPQLNQTTYYLAREFIRVVNDSGTFDTMYYHDSKDLVARKDGGGTFYYHPDHLGSTTVVTDSQTAIIENVQYEPFGRVYSGDPERFAYTGQELDPGTGLQYYGARYYDPSLAQFTTPDSVIPHPYNPQALNRYAYVLNNPYVYVDPSGNEPVTSHIGSYVGIYEELLAYDSQSPRDALASLVSFTSTFGSQAPQQATFLRDGTSRYIYTSNAGFVDNLHLFTSARYALGDPTKGAATATLGFIQELFAYLGNDPSAFSYEDIQSNTLGILFARSLRADEPLSVQYKRFVEALGASSDPQADLEYDYPGLWKRLPEVDTHTNPPLATCIFPCVGKAVPPATGGSEYRKEGGTWPPPYGCGFTECS